MILFCFLATQLPRCPYKNENTSNIENTSHFTRSGDNIDTQGTYIEIEINIEFSWKNLIMKLRILHI
ncbi:MAG: hypothetical protein ACFFCW_05475, partial [Candidatus Hodarchaeota archaeon]